MPGLTDLYDPASYLRQANPLMNLGSQPKLPAMQPDEAEGLLSQAVGSTLGGMSYAAKSLGKAFGGRAIRGLLGGNLRELASVIPLSDFTGLTREQDEVTGEDLAKQWGWIGEGTKGTLEARDFVGPLLEAALDPGSYLSLGAHALNPLGQAAKQLGVVPKTMAGRIAGFAPGTQELAALAGKMGVPEAKLAGKALGGVAGLGVPFMNPLVTLGEGAKGAWVADKLGTVADAAKYSLPGRGLSALFDPDVRGVMDTATQRAAREYADANRLAQGAAKGQMIGVIRGLQEGGAADFKDELRGMLEGTFTGVPLAPDVADALRTAADKIRSMNPVMIQAGRGLGIPEKELADRYIDYAARYLTPLAKETPGFEGIARRNFPAGHPSLNPREDILRDVQGGTAKLNALSIRPDLSGPGATANALQAADILRREAYGLDPAEFHRLKGAASAGTATPLELQKLDALEPLWKRAEGLADYFRSLDPVRVQEGRALFDNHPAIDAWMRVMGHERATGNAQITHAALASAATDAAAAGPGAERLIDVLERALPHNELTAGGQSLRDYLQTLQGYNQLGHPMAPLAAMPSGAWATQLERLAGLGKLQGAGLNDQLLELADKFVPASTAAAVTRLGNPLTAPAGLEPFLRMYDSFGNLFKVLNTSVWPSKVTRDAVQSGFSNLAGIGPGTLGVLPQVSRLRAGQVLQGLQDIPLFRGMNDEQATKALADLMAQHNVLHSPMLTQGGDVIGHGPHMASTDFTLPGPGNKLDTFGDYFKTLVSPTAGDNSLKPWAVRGVGGVASMTGRNTTDFWLAKAGQQWESAVSDSARGSGFLALLKQGYEPAAAAAEVAALHGGAPQTEFERAVMKRLVPFYGFLRHNTPMVANEVATRPGGLMAMTMKGAAGLRSQDGFLPEYLGEGLALPVGQEDNGTQRYLTRFDLPHEAAFDMIGGGADRGQRTLANVLAQTNPLLKLVIEGATGKQLYTGRELSDLHSPTGNGLLDQLVWNSPASRLAKTAETLTDPRKDLLATLVNLVSPARVSDVDLAKAKIVEGSKLIKEQLKGNPAVKNFEELSVPAANMGQLSPEEQKLYGLFRYLQAQQIKRGKEAKIGIHQGQ